MAERRCALCSSGDDVRSLGKGPGPTPAIGLCRACRACRAENNVFDAALGPWPEKPAPPPPQVDPED